MITIDFDRLDITPGCRILDIGCGTGRHTCGAFRFRNVVAIGVDINFDDVFEARIRVENQERLGEHGVGICKVAVADIYHLPFRDNYFDLVICSEILEHLHDEKTAVSEAVRVLKPRKDLVVSVPNYLPERICWALSENYHNTENGHVRIYKKKALMDLLKRKGLKSWGHHSAHSLHVPYWWLKCLVGPEREDSRLVNLYHRLLVWDIMKHPSITRFLDRLFNPVMGKSLVVYLTKNDPKPQF